MAQDLTAAVEELRARGVKVLQEPRTIRPGTHIAFVEGPDHTRIEVLQRDVPVGQQEKIASGSRFGASKAAKVSHSPSSPPDTT